MTEKSSSNTMGMNLPVIIIVLAMSLCPNQNYLLRRCPWCIDALSYFKSKSIDLEIIEVRNDPKRMKELLEISGQSKT